MYSRSSGGVVISCTVGLHPGRADFLGTVGLLRSHAFPGTVDHMGDLLSQVQLVLHTGELLAQIDYVGLLGELLSQVQ